MYVKLKDNQIEKYPYTLNELKQDNKNVSFPSKPSDEILAQFNVYAVVSVTKPLVTYKQNMVEGNPQLVNGVWTQSWVVTDKSSDEINALNESLRAEAYRNESDPLFFKAQRGEIQMQVWLDKVTEIKERYK